MRGGARGLGVNYVESGAGIGAKGCGELFARAGRQAVGTKDGCHDFGGALRYALPFQPVDDLLIGGRGSRVGRVVVTPETLGGSNELSQQIRFVPTPWPIHVPECDGLGQPGELCSGFVLYLFKPHGEI